MNAAASPRDQARCLAKMRLCVRHARDCSRAYRETGDRRYLDIKHESMHGLCSARWWRTKALASTC